MSVTSQEVAGLESVDLSRYTVFNAGTVDGARHTCEVLGLAGVGCYRIGRQVAVDREAVASRGVEVQAAIDRGRRFSSL